MNHETSEEISRSRWQNPLYCRRIPLVLGVTILLFWLGIHHRNPEFFASPPPIDSEFPTVHDEILIPLPTPLPPWPAFTHPSPQRHWAEIENPKVYMPTGSGRVESAGYGSVRTNSSGHASFHEGVDIAPVEWSRGKAADQVFAAADGKIVYINRVAGNSSYGIYIVIEHPDDVGKVYTIYAHLASVSNNIQTGKSVTGGEYIAQMGHTSTLGIPLQRSHLHFEMGMMLNPDFDRWYRSKKMIPDHGRYHGFNFTGFDPRLMLIPLSGQKQVPFSYLETLQTKPASWEILIRSSGRPRYFDSYPKLWHGSAYNSKALLLRVSESGIPLSGRNASPEELASMGSAKSIVVNVNKEALGRNGLRHVVISRGQWILGSNGKRWLEILMYNAR